MLLTLQWFPDSPPSYPASHAMQPFISKFFYVMQIAYWLHCFPELYFQRVKKEELSARIQYAALYLGMDMSAIQS